jgi:hypothetical protein
MAVSYPAGDGPTVPYDEHYLRRSLSSIRSTLGTHRIASDDSLRLFFSHPYSPNLLEDEFSEARRAGGLQSTLWPFRCLASSSLGYVPDIRAAVYKVKLRR